MFFHSSLPVRKLLGAWKLAHFGQKCYSQIGLFSSNGTSRRPLHCSLSLLIIHSIPPAAAGSVAIMYVQEGLASEDPEVIRKARGTARQTTSSKDGKFLNARHGILRERVSNARGRFISYCGRICGIL